MPHHPDPVHTVLSWLRGAQPDLPLPAPDDLTPLFHELERDLGLTVPADVKHYFHLLNPYLASREHGLYDGLTALPLAGALRERAAFSRPDSFLLSSVCPAVEAVDPPGTVRPVGFDVGWLPVAHDHSGAYLAVDLHPDAAGQVGQVVNFGGRERTRFVLASSITAFFADLIRNVAAGRAAQDGDAGVVEVRFTDPEVTHPLDLCEQDGAAALRPAGGV
ncbi:SMI1/KNR4 family protein [Deinococcus radiotolerans]|uniref:Knr4/Smi1-like domain-containing protein n=1 Tax=Deinococcus radiotolerans TaxID=1309407 RepID=A0ABQ2FNG0_9DEIO|nr:SMI1/KNR4 family protein [Deinococcus radiotolerans]GGL11200.1 hypothetical protein GCM10010844_32310 [Deinococcus radiotolerans]